MILNIWDQDGERTRSTEPTRKILEEAIQELDWESEELAGMMGDSGLTNVKYKSLTFGVATLYVGQKPVAAAAGGE